MKAKQKTPHPIALNLQRIKEEGIVVLDDARGLPTNNEPFVSPDFVISIAHRGMLHLLYDNMPDISQAGVVAIIFPNHELMRVSASNDYLSSLIMVDATILNDPMLQIINQLRYRYESQPAVKLDKQEYKMIMNVVDVMRETSRINLPDCHTLLERQLEYLLRLLNYYRSKKLNEANQAKHTSIQFHSNLKQYAHQHRNVEFYAGLAFLSTKYFSTVIKQETGHTAAYWIRTHIVAEAKMLLHMRRDLTVQTIADMLGFDEQATFSRYFKHETGLSPSAFREE